METAPSPYDFRPVPRIYEEVMGPLYFEGYAIDMAGRVAGRHPVRVLETACGTGRLTRQLDRQLDLSVFLAASELQPAMLEVAREKGGHRPIAWQVADGQDLPYGDASFDVVTCQFGVMFFSDKLRGFCEAHRVVSPGGAFLFSVWDSLDKNPLAAAGRELFSEFFDGNPPQVLRTAFSMSDPTATLALLTQAGFAHIEFDRVPLPCEGTDAETLASSMIEGSAVREAVQQSGTERVNRLKARLEETLHRRFGSPVRSTMQALVFTALV